LERILEGMLKRLPGPKGQIEEAARSGEAQNHWQASSFRTDEAQTEEE
jgi:hypothetical protein